MESSGCKSRTVKANTQAGSECCHSPGDWWVRSVHSKEAGHEDSAPKTRLVAMPTPLTRRKAASGRPILRGRAGSPESLARGMLPKGFPMNPGELTIFARESGNAAVKGDQRRLHTDGGAVLRPRSTGEGGEPQGFRKERPRDPLEGRGKQADVSAEGNIGETQNSNCYVHKTRQTNGTSQGGTEATVFLDRSPDHARGIVRGIRK